MKSKEQKRMEAQKRQAIYDDLSKEAKLHIIAFRPGNSMKETERILKGVDHVS